MGDGNNSVFFLVIKHASVGSFSGLIKFLWGITFVKKRGKKWGYLEMGFWVKSLYDLSGNLMKEIFCRFSDPTHIKDNLYVHT